MSAKQKTPEASQAIEDIIVPTSYDPHSDKEYMSLMMRAFFRERLLEWRGELLEDSSETIQSLQEGGLNKPDITDRASEETDRALELRTRDRERKLIGQINKGLKRIEDDTFGYCEETGDPIGVDRLLARPIARMTIEAQERHERAERTRRDDD